MEVEPKLTPKGLRDYKLVTEALSGNNDRAFSELMGLYWESIYYMLLKMTGNPEDTEDLTIETFSKAFSNLNQYTADFAFSTWLFKIASNHCIDFIRKKKKNVLSIDGNEDIDSADNMEYLGGTEAGPDESMIRGQKIVIVRQLVDRLKPRYQNLVKLRYFEERSYEEISQMMNLPLGTVKAQLFRARELLSQIIKASRDNI
jgi:RNA polymerase sigma-70 factor (ECF subfamily)